MYHHAGVITATGSASNMVLLYGLLVLIAASHGYIMTVSASAYWIIEVPRAAPVPPEEQVFKLLILLLITAIGAVGA